MNIKKNITKEELTEIAKKSNKSVEEVLNDYKYALKDLEYSINKINSIIERYNYKTDFANLNIKGYGRNNELKHKYICFENVEKVDNFDKNELAIVTGFGPTDAPTAGTLATIFKVLELQRETGIYTHIIISELSALNSRQKPLDDLFFNTKQFISFIKKLGFDELNGEIRTHNFLDHARTFSIISSVFKIEDFTEGEATDEMYKRLNLIGNDYSTIVSQAYTVSDIVLPIIRDKKKGVIVVAGLEEHLYPRLAQISIDRIKVKVGGIEKLIDPQAFICALYGRLIGGLFPYVKMSKSIKESSINLGDDNETLYNKIVKCGERDEDVILQMMILASNWDYSVINQAERAYENRKACYDKWLNFKKKYYHYFINIKTLWDESKPDEEINTYNILFNKEKDK